MIELTSQSLGAVISISKGRKHEITDSPSSTSRRLIGIDDLRNDDLIRYTDDVSGTEAVPDDVLIAWDGANAGTIGYGKGGYIGSTIARLRVKSGVRLFTPFLGLYLRSKFDYLRRTATGATIPHISRSALENISLPAVEYDDQIRIAHLLGKVEGLIDQRKQHLQKLDGLLKSVFREMFGDPVRNEKGWESKEITSVCDEIVDCVNKTAPQVEERTPFIMVRTSNIRNGKITLKNIKYVDAETYKIWTRRSKPKLGDILFTREAPMGEAGLVDFEDQIFLGQRIMQYRCNTHVANPKFILELMKTQFFQRQIGKLGKGSTVKHLAVPDCFKFIVIAPPLPLQNQFADFVEKVGALKSRYQHNLADLEALYGALSQQAFKGDLDLSRVALPAAPIEGESPVSAAVPAPVTTPVIELPETDLLLPALQDRTQLAPLLHFWLEAYRMQLGGAAFSLERFTAAAQSRLAERHLDNDFEWAESDYESIKDWVFEALAAGSLTQGFDDDGNRIKLKAAAEQRLA